MQKTLLFALMLFAFPAHALVFNQDDHQLCEEYKSAKKVWLQKATEGDVSLQFKLGDFYRPPPVLISLSDEATWFTNRLYRSRRKTGTQNV